MSAAIQCLSYEWIQATKCGAHYVSEDDYCDQEGCAAKASVTYKLKKQYCSKGHEDDPYKVDQRPVLRQFCVKHAKRGNRNFDDSDGNYERFSPKRQRQVLVTSRSPTQTKRKLNKRLKL